MNEEFSDHLKRQPEADAYHLLCLVHEQQDLSRFMAHFGYHLSKEIGRIHGWRSPVWEGRHDAIVIDAEAGWVRPRYSQAHGPKKGLSRAR